MTFLGLAESFTTLARPKRARPEPTVTHVDGLFLGKYERIWHFDTIYITVSKLFFDRYL